MNIKIEKGIIKRGKGDWSYNRGGIGHVLFNTMRNHHEKIAQIDSKTGKFDTYDILLQKTIRTAMELQKRGIKKGNIISLCSEKCFDSCIPILASHFIGAVIYCLDYEEHSSETSRLLSQIPPKLILTEEKSREMLKEAVQEAQIETEIVLFGEEFFGQNKEEEEQNFQPIFVEDLTETINICFSSGSTGLPKGICLNHLSSIYGSSIVEEFENRVSLNYSKWYWGTAHNNLMRVIRKGGCLLLCTNFDPNDLWCLIQKYKVTDIEMTPYRCIEFCSTTAPKYINTSTLKIITTFGNSMAKEYFLRLREMLPGTLVCQAYGLTETGYCTRFDITNDTERKMLIEHPESVGLPLEGITYKVVDPQSGTILGPNENGELYIKSDHIFNGYYDRDCSDCFDRDGWFKTGDLVCFDEQFLFYIVARLKDRLIYRDWWVYPAQLEEILYSHPVVKKAVVVGRPHKTDFEQPTAFVVLKDTKGTPSIAKELEKFVEGKVHDYQRLSGGVVFVNDLPLTATGKIHRMQLRKLLEDGVY